MVTRLLAALLVCLLGSAPRVARAQSSAEPSSPQETTPASSSQDNTPPASEDTQSEPKVDVSELPIDLDRVQNRLAQPQTVNLQLIRPTFRTSVTRRRPRWFDEIDWTKDLRGKPTPTMPAWHTEFLNMVTPEHARMYSAYSSGELAQVAATSLLQALGANTVTNAIKDAIQRRKEEAAKREVDEAIEQWKKEREGGEP